MKLFYSFLLLVLMSAQSLAQGYELALIHDSGYNFTIAAIPDFTSSGDTDLSSAGFSLLLPAGNADIINEFSQLPGRVWNVTQIQAATLSGAGLGDGTRDLFLFNMPAGQSVFAHNNNDPIALVSFEVSNMPQSGLIEILANDDPIATGEGGVFDSFYNSNIDATFTQDYFLGITPGLESFAFSTLSVSEQEFQPDILVYPNPTSQFITITSEMEIDNITIYDVKGSQILTLDNASKIDVSQLQNGVYVLKIRISDKNIMKKIIIESN